MSNKVFIAKVRSFFEHALHVSDVCMRSEAAELRENVKMSLPFKYKLHLSSVFIRRNNVAELQFVLPPTTYLEARTRLFDGLGVFHGTAT